ncbi:MAG: OprO/OprP family phosphate-selective porin [Gammaproteobacteria bacterium]|nr:OprO/OprP family phosphate-selective porin [Gammaproteobacteria bacterium]
MKKTLITAALGLALPTVAIADDPDKHQPVLFGYMQIAGSQQFGTGGPEGMVFSGNRIRLGVKGQAVRGVDYFFHYKWDRLWQSSILNSTYNNGQGFALPGANAGVQDAYLDIHLHPYLSAQAGKYRIPLGLERVQYSGSGLPFIQRSMTQSLGGNRSIGVMLHSPNLYKTKAYYAVGIFDNHSVDAGSAFNSYNVALPVGGGQTQVGGVMSNGSGRYLFSAMVGYRPSSMFNVALSGARADAAQLYTLNGVRVPAAKNVSAWTIGVDGNIHGLKYLAEYAAVSSYGGIEGLGATDWYVAALANLHEMHLTPDWLDLEPAIRFEQFQVGSNAGLAAVTKAARVTSMAGLVNGATLDNLTLGVNYYWNPKNPNAAKVQLNYVIPSRSSAWRAAGRNIGPGNGYVYNTMVVQFQTAF